ncbi:hydantoinase/oxoprolinase family protein [Thalassotalea psychrophila]|uniref:Hydantoinase/oxoprolinase family protein n=1 Tax=Thalassotalea psychrophila TaxID=3065647 RepID=A0ABY9TZ52_9GAMM|nr:hydantoinase/oxoprolinase family protein [Colwelliaceae bacterium SQ149]
MKRIAVDIGGTFTDCFICWEDKFLQTKALTSHQNLALGFNEAIDNACAELEISRQKLLAEVDSVRYATTLGTNALIERNGPRVGLLTTFGFDSTVPLSRGRGYSEGLPDEEAKDLSRATRPDPLVPIKYIRTVKERVDYRGKVLMDLQEEQTRTAIRELVDLGVQAIVVATINSVENPTHELRVQEIFEEEYPPEMLGSIPMILSHQVVGRKGEYVRTSSSIVDAYLHSTMYFAMSSLEQNLRENGYTKPMLLVHNSGGMAQLNSTDALQTVHSGPVAGIHAAEELSKQSNMDNIVCGDMGGTSFDIGIITKGGEKHYDFNPVVDRWLVTVPMVHLVTLGAGGGSIAKYDSVFNTVKVGPMSAGSDPGPAAYDRGGMNPTVTDADLLLGYLDTKNYANGYIKLNMRRTYQALEDICDELDIEEIEAAKFIKSNADGEMASGLTQELNRQGYKAEDFVFLAYGGNGPLHACGIAERAGINRVLAPPYSSVFSACGGAGLNQMHIHEKNVSYPFFHKNLQAIFSDFDGFNSIVEELEVKGRNDLIRQGISEEQIKYRVELDMRYSIQKMEVSVVAPKTRLESSTDVIQLIETMNADFGSRYGEEIVSPESGVWVGTVRVVSWVELPALKFEDMTPPTTKISTPKPVAYRDCHFVGLEGAQKTPIYDGLALQPGVVIEGPAVVNPGATTYLVEPGWRLESAAQGAVWLLKQ